MATSKTRETIIKLLKEKDRVSPKELTSLLGISNRAVFKQIKTLMQDGVIDKIGTPPRVYYFLKKEVQAIERPQKLCSPEVIDARFYTVTPLGIEKEGVEGFLYWCQKRKFDPEKKSIEYIETLQKYDQYAKDGLIDGTSKIKATFPRVYLDALLYVDFYAMEKFGKTKLGYMLLYAKQSQSRQHIKAIADIVSPLIQTLIKDQKIDGIAFVPPSVKREIQIMTELKTACAVDIREIPIKKIKTPIIIPQKTLSKLEDRIENAQNTMIVTETTPCNKLLIIDDATGSGSTLNEVAKQVKDKKLAKDIICLSLVGSFKGFDVISEV